jgi:hypothetical protein
VYGHHFHTWEAGAKADALATKREKIADFIMVTMLEMFDKSGPNA